MVWLSPARCRYSQLSCAPSVPTKSTKTLASREVRFRRDMGQGSLFSKNDCIYYLQNCKSDCCAKNYHKHIPYVYIYMYIYIHSVDKVMQFMYIIFTLWKTNIAIEHGPVEIVDFPMKNGGSSHSRG